MSDSQGFSKEPMMEMFLFESNQLLEQLEEILIEAEKRNKISLDEVNDIFRIMHTIKGSASMMMFNGITTLSHALEDLFHFIRESRKEVDYKKVCDYSLKTLDFIRGEIVKIENNEEANGDNTKLVTKIREFYEKLKSKTDGEIKIESKPPDGPDRKYYISAVKGPENENAKKYTIKVFYEADCMMENVRAYSITYNLKDICQEMYHRPMKLLEDDNSSQYIVQNGFDIYISSDRSEAELMKVLDEAIFTKSYSLTPVDSYYDDIADILAELDADKILTDESARMAETNVVEEAEEGKTASRAVKQNVISVNIGKLDKLMDLVGEIVITESMVTRNPDLAGLHLENFSKAARQFRKLTDELQDIVMSIRMVPVAATFHKMNRIIRDMSKNLNKDVELEIVGEDTEVDKNIIDTLSDPLMHLIRNSMDHGIEDAEQRKNSGKSSQATIRLEAQNTGGDVVIIVADDGKGLDREQILRKAKEKGMLVRPENEMNDKEVFGLILLPGFSTKDKISEYSGRGVGMDVVKKNIEKVGGSVSIESVPGKSTSVIIRIPLTLAIVDGMEVSVGKSIYTVPTISIRESFKPNERDLLQDTDGNEMIMIRGQCYPIMRMHKYYNVKTEVTELMDGIMVMVEVEDKAIVLFADKLLGEQQVVVKPLPNYLSRYQVKESGIAGCTILGDGNISLILDIVSIIDRII